jgi:D-glycero-D-manno-heptose 1,7-bisphosphate phosphatase
MTSEPVRPVVLDRDGVINVDVPGRYVCSADEWIPIDGSLPAIAALSEAGFAVYVVSNQSGVGRGLFTEQDLAAMHQKLVDSLAAQGGRLAGWFYCPHTPDDQCNCRKPRTGLLEAVSADAGVDLRGVPFVGDKWTDLLAARAMGMRAILVGTGHGRDALAAHRDEIEEYYEDLAAAVAAIIKEHGVRPS